MHISFIMDGNRRWAKRHEKSKRDGHSAGFAKHHEAIEWCLEQKISHLSMWCLAKKNIEEREEQELADIYDILLSEVLPSLRKICSEKNIRFRVVGNKALLPKSVQEELSKLEQESDKDNPSMTFVLVIGYGGQDEIVRGMKRFIMENIHALMKDPTELFARTDEKTLFKYLDSGDFPPPDLIIRSGWHDRHSGFLLYASEYSEYYFTETLWPDFEKNEFLKVLERLKGAKRNWGK